MLPALRIARHNVSGARQQPERIPGSLHGVMQAIRRLQLNHWTLQLVDSRRISAAPGDLLE